MALITVTAAKGAPGATVTSLALTLGWTRSMLLAECDPSGGSILTGYLAGQLPADRGMAKLAVADYHGRLFDDFPGQLIDLNTHDSDGPQRLLLPGITDPAQAAALPAMWDRLGAYLRQLEQSDPPFDVVADCGRVPALHAPLPLIRHADVTLLVVGRTLDAVASAIPRVELLRREIEQHGSGVLRLVIRGRGDYPAKEIAQRLGTPVAVELPEDAKTATMLSTGSGTPRASATLLRAAHSAAPPLRALIDSRRVATASTYTSREATRV